MPADSSAFRSPSGPQRDINSPGSPVRSETEVRNRDIQRLQGLQILLERVAGASIAQLAEKYQLPKPAIEGALDQAWQEGAVTALQAKIFEELAPMALAVYEAQLKLGSLEAARDIALSTGILKRPTQNLKVQPVAPTVPAPAANLADYRLERQTRQYTPAAQARRQIDLEPESTRRVS
jgi:hypothetical protein